MFKSKFEKSNLRKRFLFFLIPLIFLFLLSCGDKSKPFIKKFRLDSMDGLIATANLSFDEEVTSDGLGSVRVDTEEKTTAYLFVIDSIPVDKAKLKWSIMCKTRNFEGNVFLEMGIKIGRDEEEIETFLHYSRDSISGDTDWRKMEIEFLVDGKENLLTQLNVVIDGSGTVWLDKARFIAKPQ